MDVITKFLGIVSMCLTLLLPPLNAEDVCVTKSPCKCVFPNGTGIDLAPAAQSEFYDAQYFQELTKGGSDVSQYKLSKYSYHPCTDIKYQTIGNPSNNTCTEPLSVCRHVNVMVRQSDNTTFKIDMGIYELLGHSKDTTFSADGTSIIINTTNPSSSRIMLICAETLGELEVPAQDDPKNALLTFYSRSACLKQIESPGRSFGSTLCIIFFSLVIFYLVLGICTKKFLMGASGVEVVPNLGFWTDLPNLIKDGWAFAVSGCRLPARAAAASPDPNSYDSI